MARYEEAMLADKLVKRSTRDLLWTAQKTADGVLQPFRFVALDDDDHRRLRTSLDQVVDRSWLGKSKAFSIT